MANKEAIVKLKLSVNSKEYNQAIRAANQEAKEFKRQQREAFKNAGANEGMNALLATAKKLAPAISAGSAAFAVVNKAMKENQTFTDEWARITAGARASYESFVDSLVNADFSGFFARMESVVQSARDAADALDNLDTTKIFTNREMADLNLLASKYRLILRDKTASASDKETARLGLLETRDKQMNVARTLQGANMETFAYTLADFLSRKGLKTSASDLIEKGEDGVYRIKQGGVFEKYFKDLTVYNQMNTMYKRFKDDNKRFVNFQKVGYVTDEETGETIGLSEYKALRAALELSDEKLKEAFDYYIAGINAEISIINQKASDSRYTASVGGATTSAITAPEGSIAALRAEIAQAKQEYEVAMDDAARHAARAYVNELEEQLRYMETEHLSLGTGMALGGVSGVPALNPALVGQHLANIPITPSEGSVEDLEDNAKASEYATLGLNLLTDTIGRLGLMSNIVEPEVSKFLNVFGSIFSQVGRTIGGPAGGVLSGIGGLLGGFAGGGIVGGTSYKGDQLLQAVNSKEVILNGYQQKNLLEMINAGGGGPEIISYLLRGEDLYIAISNYKRRMRKS